MKRIKIPDPRINGTFYLNKWGSRWVCYEKGRKSKMKFKTASGQTIVRTIIEYRSFGNFASVVISYKGKKIDILPDTILD